MAVDDKKINVQKRHQLTMRGREHLAVEGVLDVESFDDAEVLIETESGMLAVRGDELRVQELNVESGKLNIFGFIHGLEYLGDAPGKRAKGLIGRLFR